MILALPLLNRFSLGKTALAKPYLVALLAVALVIAAIDIYTISRNVPTNPVSSSSPSGSPSYSITPSIAPTIMPTATQTVAPTHTQSPTPSPTATLTPSPSPTSLPTPFFTKARNWGGYIAASNLQSPQPNVTGVTGSWTVPSAAPSTNDSYSAVWIGVGGQFDRTLIQCGTEQDFVRGQTIYSAWYELLPNRAIMIHSMPVSPGDQIQASIHIVDSNTDEWFINITDVTTGGSFQRNFSYASTQLSAEWILERPTVNGILSPLADFGSVTFTNCYASLGDVLGGINSFPAIKTVMYSALGTGPDSSRLTGVSNLTANGTGFTVSFLAAK